MTVMIEISTTDQQDRTFLNWAPVKASARLMSAVGPSGTETVTLQNGGAAGGGRVVFDTERGDAALGELTLDLAADGSPSTFWVAGEFGAPSQTYGDAMINAVGSDGTVHGQHKLMVRVRKSATSLHHSERDRFLEAMAALNDAGSGPFRAFRDMHVSESENEAHGAAAFLPWHRAYLLDLERSLQAIDPTVTLPYWRFDLPAPSLFADAFLGMPPANPDAGDIISFPSGHPLEFWRTDIVDRIERRPWFDVSNAPPTQVQFPDGTIQDWVITQQATLALGGANDLYSSFRGMEEAPHGAAHVSFDGPISSVPTAAKDPLFFMLHANVDRLWALWQWLKRRTDPDDEASYSLLDSVREPNNLGHKPDDTMWPWNGVTTPPRPTFPPPRDGFPLSPVSSRPGQTPKVRDMVDLHGVRDGVDLGFSYDDVPFELEPEGGVA